MVLEATMIVVDNSESSRNGDYIPSRFEAQSDAVNILFSAKTQANPESSVGLMSMGGAGPEVLTTLTTDFGKILDGLHRTKIKGDSHLATAIQIASLALTHRQNAAQKPRIVVFTCSPIAEDQKDLVKLAKRMRKGNVSIDFVAFGDLESDTIQKLEAFNENVKGGEGSHLAIIPPGPHLLSDELLSTPILGGDGTAAAGRTEAGEPADNGFEFGVDPSTDPELALALRMSYEEEKARQEKERKEKEEREKQEKAALEGIPEEQPLLNKEGEPSGSGSKDDDKKKGTDDDDHDKMDIA